MYCRMGSVLVAEVMSVFTLCRLGPRFHEKVSSFAVVAHQGMSSVSGKTFAFIVRAGNRRDPDAASVGALVTSPPAIAFAIGRYERDLRQTRPCSWLPKRVDGQ
jgi:hypothetical protein